MRAKLQPSIFTVSTHLQKKTLVNITFYMCIKSFQVSNSEYLESESEDVIEGSYLILSEVVRVYRLHAGRDWREVVLLRKSLRHLWYNHHICFTLKLDSFG